MTDQDIRADMRARFVSAIARWEQIATYKRSAGESDDAIDAEAVVYRLTMALSVLKSRAHRAVVTDDYLVEISRKPTVQCAALIENLMPGGRFPEQKRDVALTRAQKRRTLAGAETVSDADRAEFEAMKAEDDAEADAPIFTAQERADILSGKLTVSRATHDRAEREQQSASKDDRSLEGWTNIILGKNRTE